MKIKVYHDFIIIEMAGSTVSSQQKFVLNLVSSINLSVCAMELSFAFKITKVFDIKLYESFN